MIRWGFRLAIALAGAAFVFFQISPAPAQSVAVDVELVLAVDVSASIDRTEVDLQRAGYLSALTQPAVVDAMLSGPLGRIAVTFIEWSKTQRTVIGWTIIDSPQAAQAFAAAVAAQPQPPGGLTSIRGALDFSVASIEANGIEGTRRVIDLSADGRDWEGDGQIVAAARQRALDRGIVINGLAIRPDLEQTEVEGVKYDLNGYFHAFVVGGPGSFTMVVENPADFPQTVAKKLILEIAGLPDAERSAISN
ncbi:MAG: DUF1194 domain-containing protein [Alphaproteobacteria bacterium]|nr:DUF1194 domain-containing protein [Alphaproteobacteria bacterium]